jgi:transcriptional regulator with XRE-family HTH domain
MGVPESRRDEEKTLTVVSSQDTVSTMPDVFNGSVDEKKIVENIKQTRLAAGISLDRLAKLTGLTKGYLSKIENAEKVPPFSTLVKIASALNVDISRLISGDSEIQPPTRLSIVRAGERHRVATKGTLYGYRYEALAYNKPGKNMEPYILIPSTDEKAVFSHEGEEFMYVLEGTHEFVYDGERYVLEEGDSIYFDSAVPHSGKSIGPKQARVLAVMYSYKRF